MTTTDLTIAPAIRIGEAMMDAAEARETINLMSADMGMVDHYADSFRRRALDFRDREGWKALDYAGYVEAIQAELGAQYSKSYISRLLQAAEIERVLELPIGNSVPESVLREVAKAATPDQQRAAYQAATVGGPATAKKVQQAVKAIGSPFWQSMTPNHPTAHLWTQLGMNEHRAACGMIASRAPSGSTEAGHCSSCVRATWPQSQAAPPEPIATDRTIPADLKGWHWLSGKRDDYQLTNGDYQTRVYDHPHHAIVGARNYLASQQPEAAPGWICEGCGSRITDMKRPMNPICTQCAIQRLNERAKATPVADGIPHLPPDFTDAQKRAAKIGLAVAMDMNGKFSIKNDRGSGVDQIAEWDSLLRHLAYSEQTAAEIAAERSKQPRGFVGITLSENLQRRLVAVGAAIGGDGTVYAPRGSGEPQAVLSESEAEAAIVRWAALLQAPARSETERISDSAKRRAIGLLRQLEPLMKLITTGDQEGLSQAISDLNECVEGTEGLHWLRAGYALCDVEADDA